MNRIESEVGVYGYVRGHFYIECVCGSDKGCYYKSCISNKTDFDKTDYSIKTQVRSDVDFYKKNLGSIYYTNVIVLENILLAAFYKDRIPVTLVCRGCKNEFDLTPELFAKVVGRKIDK